MIRKFVLLIALAVTAHGQQADWPTGDAKTAGMDAAALTAFDAEIASGKFGNIDNLTIVRHGKLIFDKRYAHDYDKIYGDQARTRSPLNALDFTSQYNYYNAWWHPWYRRGEVHTLQSVSKTITSIIIGVARTRKEFPDLDTPVMNFFDPAKVANVDERKKRLTIRHLLTMSDGIEWNESLPYTDPNNSCIQMEASFDWIKFVIDRPMSHEPGTRWNYNSGATELLAHIFTVATGKDIEDYAAQHLFTPLGIKQFYWKRTPTGLVDTEGGVYLRPRDLAKLWYLFVKNGTWEGKQILSPEWIRESVKPAFDLNGAKYGYKWWLYPYGPENSKTAWAGNGFGGQLPMAFPEYDMVVVYTAWNVNNNKGIRRRDAIDRVINTIRDTKTADPGE